MNILLAILVFSVVGLVVTVFVYLSHKKKSKEKIHNLQKALAMVKSELDKNIEELRLAQEKSHYDIYAGEIVSQMNQGIICIDQNRKVQFINRYAKQFLKIVPAVGKPYQDVLDFQINEKSDYSLFEEALSGEDQTLPEHAEIITQRGQIPISGIITLLTSDKLSKTIVFIFADNSQNILRLQEEKAFFSAAAHEMKTPLSAVLTTSSLLVQRFDNLKQKEVIEYLKDMHESIKHLGDLVNDFLNVSRLDQGRLVVESKPFNMVELCDEVIKELSPLIKQRKLYLNHEPVKDEDYRNVLGDQIKAKEVLTNLISNSIKYTIQGGITISHHVVDTTLVTKVTDTGSGIPVESQKLLFKRFFQIGAARQQSTAKSTGLGLYISKKIAQLMHGDVSLESSKPGKGSTFTFTLPLVAK